MDDNVGGQNAPDPLEMLERARRLVALGLRDRALRCYLWCYFEGCATGTPFSVLRLSAVLPDIISLARDFPPAATAVKSRRDECERAALRGDATSDCVQELVAIDKALGHPERSVALFDRLVFERDNGGDSLIRCLVPLIMSDLLERRRYNDIIAHSEPVFRVVERTCYAHLRFEEYLRKAELAQRPHSNTAATRRMRVEITCEICEQYYEAALGAGEESSAGLVAQVALSTIGEWACTYSRLAMAANRVGRRDLAMAIYEQGFGRLHGQERNALRSFIVGSGIEFPNTGQE